MVAHILAKDKVTGSSPVYRSRYKYDSLINILVSVYIDRPAAVAKWLRRHSDKMVCDCPNQSCRTYAYVIQRSKIVDSQSIALGSNPSIGTLRL